MEPGPGDSPLPSGHRRIADIEHSFDRLNVATPTDKFALTEMDMVVEFTPARPVVVELSAQDLRDRLYQALDVYVTAMGYPRGTEHHRAPMWTEHVTRPGWRAVGALLPT